MFGHYNANGMAGKQMASSKPKKKYQPSPIPQPENKEPTEQELIDEKTRKAKEERRLAQEEGNKRAKELFEDETIQGLDPAKRQAMQYEANKGIQRSVQAANRKLLGEQGMRGIGGRGGVGYAQQRDLQKMGMEAQSAEQRDLDKLNADLRLKKIAAIFAGEQGEAAQNLLDRQTAIDEIELANERKKQKYYQDKYDELFSRL